MIGSSKFSIYKQKANSGGGGGTYGYFRLYISMNAAASTCIIAEITVAETIGGSNVATGGTATASSEYVGGEAYNAFDGDSVNTYWNSTGSVPQWIMYQFTTSRTIKEVTITALAGYQDYAPGDFFIDSSSDGINWTTLGMYSGITWSSGETKTFTLSTPSVVSLPSADMCLQFDGSLTTDSAPTPNSITNEGCSLDTTLKKYGTGSASFGSTADLLCADASWMNFGTGDFTISMWVYPTDLSYYAMLLDRDADWRLYYYNSYIYTFSGIAFYTPMSLNQWNHIGVVRSSSYLSVYINGWSSSTGAQYDPNDHTGSGPIYIGTAYNYSQWWYGNFDEVYVKNGTAVWTSNFIPPNKYT